MPSHANAAVEGPATLPEQAIVHMLILAISIEALASQKLVGKKTNNFRSSLTFPSEEKTVITISVIFCKRQANLSMSI